MTKQQGPQGIPGPIGPEGPAGDSALLKIAERTVDKLIAADRWRKVQVRVLGAMVILLAAVLAFTTYGYFQNKELAATLRAGSLSECISSNTHLQTQITVWDGFITLLLEGSTDKTAIAKGKEFEAYIATQFSQRDCYAIYHVTPPKGYVSPK